MGKPLNTMQSIAARSTASGDRDPVMPLVNAGMLLRTSQLPDVDTGGVNTTPDLKLLASISTRDLLSLV